MKILVHLLAVKFSPRYLVMRVCSNPRYARDAQPTRLGYEYTADGLRGAHGKRLAGIGLIASGLR